MSQGLPQTEADNRFGGAQRPRSAAADRIGENSRWIISGRWGKRQHDLAAVCHASAPAQRSVHTGPPESKFLCAAFNL